MQPGNLEIMVSSLFPMFFPLVVLVQKRAIVGARVKSLCHNKGNQD